MFDLFHIGWKVCLDGLQEVTWSIRYGWKVCLDGLQEVTWSISGRYV